MSRFFLTVVASAAYVTDAPVLDVWVNGVSAGTASVTAHTGVGTSTLNFSLDFSGTFPASLALKFNDGFAEGGRSITFSNVYVNGIEVGTAYWSTLLALTQGQGNSLTVASIDHLFGRVEPVTADLGVATINGTAGANILNGTAGNDIVDGKGGNDKINGKGGNDNITGGLGNDIVTGGAGNDLIMGDSGNDTLSGNDGDDLIYGGVGFDIIDGGANNDTISGGADLDVLTGGSGNDILYGEAGDDILDGGIGDDYLYGDDGNDTMIGGTGNDVLYGGNNNDQISGGAGNDTIYGEAGNDIIDAGNGTDTVDGGDGNDQINGGLSADTLSGGNDDDIVVGDVGADILNGDAGNDILIGNTEADTINGGDGNDVVYGHTANSAALAVILAANPGVVFNSAGNSFYRLVAGPADYATASAAAAATLLGGVAGHLVTVTSALENGAVLSVAAGNTVWLGASDAATEGAWLWQGGTENGLQFWSGTSGGSAQNGLYTNWAAGQPDDSGNADAAVMGAAGTWSDEAVGGSFAYIIEWDGANFGEDNAIDILSGGADNDLLYGGGGNDFIYGNAGTDVLFGEAGNDTLEGGAGADYQSGGAGNDTYNLANGDFASGETVTDSAGTDVIVLTTSGTTVDFTTGTLAGVETLTGSGGNDTVTVYATSAAGMFTSINLGAGTDSLSVKVSGTMNIAAASLAVLGGVENAYITGTAGDDVFTLTATQFNALIAGTGTLDLGAGAGDTVNLDATSADLNTLGATDASIQGVEAVSFAAAAAGATLTLSGQSEGFTVTGSAFADTITGGSGADVISAGNGNNVITAGAGADAVTAGTGTDTFNLANGDFAAGESIDGGAGGDTIVLTTSGTTVDFTTGTLAGIETLTGSGGNDTVTVFATSYAGMFTSINLGGGTDRLNVAVSGVMDISGVASPATLTSVENGYLTGTAGTDSITLTGAQLNALLIGAGTVDLGAGAGDTVDLTSTSADLNTLGAADDAYIDGVEAFSFSTAAGAITLDLSAQTEDFTVTGGASADTITSGDGNDVITGGAGADTIETGDGDDIVNLANGDFASGESISSLGGADEIVLTNATTVDFTTGTLSGISVLTGSGGNDTVTLSAAQLVAFASADLAGGTDSLSMYVSGTVDISADTLPAFSNIEAGNIRGTGGNNDVLTLTSAQLDSLVIGTGTIDLGAGTGDTLNLDGTSAVLNTLGATNASIAGVEAVSFAAAGAGITVSLSGQTEGFTITGSAFADTITGGGGNDTINLSNGAFGAGESITGGGGTDIILLTNATTVDFTTGTLAAVETLTGSTGGNDTVTMSDLQWSGFSTINLVSGTDTVNVLASGDISALGTPAVSNVDTGNLTGTAGNDAITLTGAQLDAIIIGSGTINLGTGSSDTINLKSTSADLNTLGATDASIQGVEAISASAAAGAVTISLSAQTEDMTVTGSGSGDTITGGRGNFTIYAGGGNDTVTSSSIDTLAAQITAITTANPSVSYNSTTGSFYQYVNSAVTWATAAAAAAATFINGVAGHLVQINNSSENSAIDTLGGGNSVWVGVNDTGTEGTYRLIGGPMDAIIMRSGGAAQNGIYANWAFFNPNASAADDDYIRQENGGTWTDQTAATTSRYVIEWEASQLLSPDSTTIISGGAGTDTMTGGAGQDYFLFEASSWGTNDTINSYDRTDLDVLDIGLLLNGFVQGTSDVDAFARLTVSGGNLLLDVDANGTGASYTTVATLAGLGASGLNIEEMVANNLLVMSQAPTVLFNFTWGTGSYLYSSSTLGTATFTDTAIGYGVSGNDMFLVDRTSLQARLEYLDAGAPNGLTVTGSSKDDNILIEGIVASVTITASLGAGNDEITITTSGNSTVSGGNGNDTITTGSGTDVLTGGAGVDVMDGGSGNDTFNLANGDFAAGESVTGGSGATDTIVLTNATTVDFSAGTLATVERLTGSTAGNDTVTLTAAQWAGFSTIDLVSGTDVLNVAASGNISASGTPTVSNVDTGNLVGTSGDDAVTLTGAQLDAIIIGAGTIALSGGTADTINLTSTSADLNTLGATDASITGLEVISASGAGAGVTVTLTNQTEGFTVTGGSFNDTVTGGGGGDTIDGGAGAGNDTLNGNGGTDTVSYASAGSAVTVSLALQGASQNTVGAGSDTLSNFENLTGSSYNDTLTGDGNVNTIHGGAGNDTIYGGGNNDILYGDSGSDTLYGEAGNDTLYSGSIDTLAAQIAAITAANPGVTYNTTTGSFYKYVSTAASWTAANTAAAATLINGVAGHLVQINNASENSYVDTTGGGNRVWLGLSDSATENTFKFMGGVMDGITVSIGSTAQNSIYTRWRAGQPDNSGGNQDYVAQRDGGQWSDYGTTGTGSSNRYIIEWEGSQLLTPTEGTVLSGGAGTDMLTGSAGRETFLFEATSWGSNDVISGYDKTDLDRIDIGDLLTGYIAGTSDSDAFARFSVSGADLLLQVDQNGTTGGASYSTVATLSGMGTSGLNIEEMVANGLLIMT